MQNWEEEIEKAKQEERERIIKIINSFSGDACYATDNIIKQISEIK